MRLVYLVICVMTVVAVKARPEPPIYMGLQQQSQRALPLSGHAIDPYIYQQLPQEHNFGKFAVSSPNYGTPLLDTAYTEMPLEDSYNAAYRYSNSQQHQTGYESGATETQIHKHIYVHVPPKDFDEEDVIQPRVTHQSGPKQKHYKIVFIKAPNAPDMRTPIAPPAPQNEEKTLIYVLHKKPEIQPNIIIPTPEPTKPSKPEVYFIKYQNKKEEALVYGPPQIFNEAKSRKTLDQGTNEVLPTDLAEYDFMTTTPPQPQYQEEEQEPSQFPAINVDMHNAAPKTNFINENMQSSTLEPPNQYLPPDTTLAPIVVSDVENPPHLPVSVYGTPNHSGFFIKKRI